MVRVLLALLLVGMCLLALACGDDDDDSNGGAEPTATADVGEDGDDDGGDDGGSSGIKVSSQAFNEGESIPEEFTCDGDNVAPPIGWTGIPEDAKTLALVLDDSDADGFVHWVVFEIPVKVTGFGVTPDLPDLPSEAKQAANDFELVGYAGPCPPEGEEHEYQFRVFALGESLGLDSGSPGADVIAAIEAAEPLDEGELTALYAR